MSTDRLPSYAGRAWAIKIADDGKVLSVHHFESEDTRDGWTMMDRTSRIAVPSSHKAVRAWLGEKTIWERIVDYFLMIFGN